MTRRRATSFLLLVLAVFLAAVFLAAWLLRTENDTAPPTAPGSELPRVQDPASPAVVDAPRSERIPIAPDPESAPPTSIEVRVRIETGEPVAGATVRFVKPAFNYFDLPLKQRERYSRSTEEHLREFGLCQTTDESQIGRRGSPSLDLKAAAIDGSEPRGNVDIEHGAVVDDAHGHELPDAPVQRRRRQEPEGVREPVPVGVRQETAHVPARCSSFKFILRSFADIQEEPVAIQITKIVEIRRYLAGI